MAHGCCSSRPAASGSVSFSQRARLPPAAASDVMAMAPSARFCSIGGLAQPPFWLHSCRRRYSSSSSTALQLRQQATQRQQWRVPALPPRPQQQFRLPPRPQQQQQPAEPAWAAAQGPSHTQELYRVTDEPISTFGFASGFSDKYELLENEELGRGTYGVVYVGQDRTTGERVAVKRMPKRWKGDHLEQYYARRVVNEVDIARHLGGSLSVCYLYEAYEDAENVDLVMELCTGGQLWDRILEGSYSERQAARLVRAILRAVAQCHGLGVLMRDVKPENFMFKDTSPDAPLKAIDFGISVFCRPGQYIDVRAGTPIYIAPEVLKMHYTFSADIWSVGIIAYQLLTGKLPFSGEEGSEVSQLYMSKQLFVAKDVFRAVLYAHLDFEAPAWESLSPEAKGFVQSLLQRDERLRPTAEEALQHPWLREDCTEESCPEGPWDSPLADSTVQRLQRFGTFGRLRRAVLNRVVATLSTDKAALKGLRELFHQLDTEGTGRIAADRVRAALLRGKFDISEEEAEHLLAQMDLDGNGEIDIDEFLAAMVDWGDVRGTADWDNLVVNAFQSIDQGGKGSLSPEDLEALLCGEGGCAWPDEVESALREADTDHDGRVSLDEFRAFINERQDDSLELFDSRLRSTGSSGSSSGSGASLSSLSGSRSEGRKAAGTGSTGADPRDGSGPEPTP